MKAFACGLCAGLILLLATQTFALERTEARISDRDPEDWAAGNTCTVSYYNTCTGWLWIWSGWQPTDKVGLVLEPCSTNPATTLIATTLYAWTGAPSGYGFTGTVAVSTVDGSGCPVTQLASSALLPVTGSNINLWGIYVGQDLDLVVTYQHAENPLPDPTAWVTDHPAAGPTGPAACGTCYPTTRPTHSFYYGTATTSLCPGSPLSDSVCDAEWLLWGASFIAFVDIVEPSSWAKVKHLYR